MTSPAPLVVRPLREQVYDHLRLMMDRGELRALNLDQAVYLVLAPLMFLMFSQSTPALCIPNAERFSPQEYIRLQADNVLQGLCVRSA